MEVHGIGSVKANELVKCGFKTIKDLKIVKQLGII